MESAAWSTSVSPPEGLGLLFLLLPHFPQVAECGPAREPQPLEVSPRKRLPAGLDQDPCSSRPAPEGAGASTEQGHSAGGGGWCRHCHTKLVELKRQAWKLVSGPGTPLRVSDSSSDHISDKAELELGRVWGWSLEHGGFNMSPLVLPSFPVCKSGYRVQPTLGVLLHVRGGWVDFFPGYRCPIAGAILFGRSR